MNENTNKLKDFKNKVLHGDCLELMKELPDNSIDAVITDPPYGIKFMGKKWDADVPSVEVWKECFRVLKPGGFLLCFAGTKTYHRMATYIEDAGFEIKDMITWLYGSGFPKGINISKAIDKLMGVERTDFIDNPERRYKYQAKSEVRIFGKHSEKYTDYSKISLAKSEEAKAFEGWNTALKPAFEPICVAIKPIEEKTFAENCLKWGVGGMNIDACRVPTEEHISTHTKKTNSVHFSQLKAKESYQTEGQKLGRWAANVIHSGDDCILKKFPYSTSGELKGGKSGMGNCGNVVFRNSINVNNFSKSEGSAARFYYCAKPTKEERESGLMYPKQDNRANIHPTIKPQTLMQYLIKLVTKENYTVLDPFGGSGTTAIAAIKLKRNFVTIEKEKEYYEIICKRIEFFIKKENEKLF